MERFKKIEIPDSLKINLEKWKTRLPIREDFMESNYLLFFEYNWIHILYGLNLINEDVLKESIKLFPNDWLNHVDQKLDLISKYDIDNIGHKEYLNIIRNNE